MKKRVIFIALAGFFVSAMIIAGARYFLPRYVEEPAPVPETNLSPDEISNEAFAELFPDQYNSFMAGYEEGASDPTSKFEEDEQPMLPILYNGSAFAKDYNNPNGHAHAVEDANNSARMDDEVGGGCLTCKSSAAPTLIHEMGDAYYDTANYWTEVYPAAEEMGHSSIGCSDCHDPVTMELQVTRPHFEEGMEAQGVHMDEASEDEMRNYVCGQCHVTYYMPSNESGEPTSKPVLPLAGGYSANDMFAYFQTDEVKATFSQDYISNISGAQMYKPRHPDYETYMQSTHGQLGVDCADCHMPVVENEDGETYTSHSMSSPLMDMEASCAQQEGCHRKQDIPNLETTMVRKSEDYNELLLETEDVLATAHYYVNKLITSGADEEVIADCQKALSYSQWLWDYTASENSDGLHAFDVQMNNLEQSLDVSNSVIKTATKELERLGVDINELNSEIEKTKQAVINEPNPDLKYTHATNEYFPPQKK